MVDVITFEYAYGMDIYKSRIVMEQRQYRTAQNELSLQCPQGSSERKAI